MNGIVGIKPANNEIPTYLIVFPTSVAEKNMRRRMLSEPAMIPAISNGIIG